MSVAGWSRARRYPGDTAKAPRSKRPRGLAVISTDMARCGEGPGEPRSPHDGRPGVSRNDCRTPGRSDGRVISTRRTGDRHTRTERNSGPAMTCGGTTARWLPLGGVPDRSPRPARTDPVASSTALGRLPHLGTLRAEAPRAGPPGDRTVRHCVLAGQSGFPCSEPPRFPGSFRLSCGADDVVLVGGENPSQPPWNGQFLSTGSSQIRPHPSPRSGVWTHTPVEKRCARHAGRRRRVPRPGYPREVELPARDRRL